MSDPRLWIVSEVYFPEEVATGYILTRIAEELAKVRSVRVICGQPNYQYRSILAPRNETRQGVPIERCFGTRLDKNFIPFRLINAISLTFAIFVRTLFRFRRGDQVLVVTNPPLLPAAVSLACVLRGARLTLLIHDVFPEAMVATGMIRDGSFFTRIASRVSAALYRSADRIVVIGRDMQHLVRRKLHSDTDTTVYIPNWADLDLVYPLPKHENALLHQQQLTKKFVVQYAGNMGRPNAIELLFETALSLETHSDIHFLCIGEGAKRGWLEQQIALHRLKNVTLLPSRPRTDQLMFLNACDVALIPYVSGMSGVGVPSRSYNIMAAGKPVIAVMDHDAEIARVVKEAQIGWVVVPTDKNALMCAILEARADPARLRAMGNRARAVAERDYSSNLILARYVDLLARA